MYESTLRKNPAGILFVYYDYVQNILFFVLGVQ